MSKRRVALVALACIALLVFWVFTPEQEIPREVYFNPAASSIDVDSEQRVELSWAYQVANVGSEDAFVRIAGVEQSTESGWEFVRDFIFAQRFLKLTEVNAGKTEELYYEVSTKSDAPIRLHFVVFMEASLKRKLKSALKRIPLALDKRLSFNDVWRRNLYVPRYTVVAPPIAFERNSDSKIEFETGGGSESNVPNQSIE